MAGKNNTELAPAGKGGLPAKLDIEDGDTDLYNPEEPVLVYVKVRHKDLKAGDGKKVERSAGVFAFSDDRPDAEVLSGAIIGSQRGRVYFEKLEDSQPTCKSVDAVQGNREREGNKYGECASCVLGRFANGETPKCREIRNLFIVELDENEKVCDGYVLTLGPSGLRPWRAHDNAILRLGRRSKPDIEAAPHHLVKVRITTDYRDEPAPHFIPIFEVEQAAGKALADELRRQRKAESDRLRQAHEAQEHKAEDYYGSKNGEDKDDDNFPF